MSNSTTMSKSRLYIGATILIIGFMSPLLIPLVATTEWSVGLKGAVSGLLAFGIPELFMLIAIGVMGKQGHEFLKSKLFKYLSKFAPPDAVSLVRYRVGLILFTLPLIMGWMHPYLGNYIAFLKDLPLWAYIIGDAMFFVSFFVLGGDFWDKFSGLFNHKAKILISDTVVIQNASKLE